MEIDNLESSLQSRSGSCVWLALMGVTILLLSTSALVAQDSQYWTNQYGNRARLLGGAVVGSVDDASAVYYNPGALALVDDVKLLLAGRVVEIQSVSVDGFESQSSDTSELRLDLAPSLFAGEFKLEGRPQDRLAYSFLTRHNSKFRLRSRSQLSSVDLGLAGSAFLANDFYAELDLNEYWFGATWAHRLNGKTGVGVSTYFAYRGHRVNLQNTTQALSNDGLGAIGVLTDDFRYSHLRLLWKVGISSKWQQWQVGVTVTTPGIGLWGNGKRSIDDSLVTQFPGPGGQPITEINTFYEETGSSYKNPFSVAFGAGRRFGATRLHLTGEFFAPVDEFTVIDSQPFEGQTSGKVIETAVTRDLDSVFNVAVGVEHQLKEALGLYGAFNTDFNATDSDGIDRVSVGEFDLYHLSGGVSLNIKGSDLTLGGSWAFSTRGGVRRLIGVLPEDLHISYNRFSFIVGFDFDFN